MDGASGVGEGDGAVVGYCGCAGFSDFVRLGALIVQGDVFFI